MGLSLYDAVLVGPDSFKTTIPLTDELFGFPRISWPASTNENVTSYKIEFSTGTGAFAGRLRVEAPRTFLHEGDWIEAGYKGMDLGTVSSGTFEYIVTTDNGAVEEQVSSGTFVVSVKPNSGTRRTMEAISPTVRSTVHGSLVEFQWKMDWRTQGVFFTVKDASTGKAVPGLDRLYVPFPVRHNKVTDDDYYYSYFPQLENGRTIVNLPSGTYWYTIEENIRNTSVTPQSITEKFTLESDTDGSRARAAIKGHIHYYGRQWFSMIPKKVVVQAYEVSNRARTSLSVGGNPIARTTVKDDGSFEFHGLKAGTYGIIAWADVDGDGLFENSDTWGFGFLGGSASPVQVPSWCVPLAITNTPDYVAVDLEDVHVVLRDRDTDSDGVPNGPGFPTDENVTQRRNNLREMPLHTFPGRVPAGCNWISPSLFSTNKITSTSSTWIDVIGGGVETEFVTKDFVVKAPRTFLHEGDLQAGGLLGFNLGETNSIDVTWSVLATDGRNAETLGGDMFTVWAPYRTGGVPSPEWAVTNTASINYRKTMKARWPTQKTVVRGSVVDFEWEMDEHTAGVTFKIEGISAGNSHISTNVVVAFPVLHWDPTVQCYYYKARPQMEDGLRFLDLPDGTYRYSITERTRSNMIPAQTITETFQLRNAENSRTTGSIEGDIWYYGRSTVPGTKPPRWKNDLHVQAYLTSGDATTSASVGGMIVDESIQRTNGAFRLEGLKAGTYTVFAFVDSNGNGVADDWETQGFGFYGGNASPVVIPSTAIPIVVTNGASVVGVNVVLHDRDTDRDLLPDVWEYETYGSLTSQTGYDAAASNAYTRLKLPDATILTNWIWKIDRETVITKEVQIDITDSIRVRIDAPRTFLHEGDLLTPYVYKQRHSGIRALGVTGLDDPAMAYETQMNDRVNRSDYLDDPENREYYLWLKDQYTGVWNPLDSPVYGFDLGSSSNALVKWSVVSWDGDTTTSVTDGYFHVVSTIGRLRKPVAARYPTQGTKLYGNLVEFEWEMDDHNAGVLFDLWKIGNRGEDGSLITPFYVTNDFTGEVTLIEAGGRYPVVEGKVIALPVRHGKFGADGGFYSAVPQIDDGALYDRVLMKYEWSPDNGKAFVELPGDGWYEYRITERPRLSASIVDPKSVVERFQIANGDENNRGRYDASGNIRYYGKVMEREIITELDGEWEVEDGQARFTACVDDPGALAPGSMGVLLVRAKQGDETSGNWYNAAGAATWAEEVFNDSAANGVLNGCSTTNSLAKGGTIDYESGDIVLKFRKRPPNDCKIVLVRKVFPAPLVLQAYKLADAAKTCVSVSGTPVYQTTRNTKGLFTIPNLLKGNYAILAFIDSNGNGYADFWETQGFAEKTATVSPNIDAASAPIHVGGDDSNVIGLMIVLHDRDTDNDLVPDSWEWWKTADDPQGSRLTRSGYDVTDASGLMWYKEYADGILDSDPRTPDTDLDGLTDAMEILVTGTDTHLRDTDDDGIGDLEEFLSGSDPLDANDAVPYTVPALAFDENGTPFVDIAYPALKPGVVLTYELQRKAALDADGWETVAEHEVSNTGGAVLYSQYDGVNVNMSAPGTARMLPADQAEGEDFTTGFYRVKVYADYGKMVDNGDGTWSYWTWVKTGSSSFVYKEAARGAGKLIRDSAGNWSFVSDATGRKGVLVRDDGTALLLSNSSAHLYIP